MKIKKIQFGRSMVEMLGVLAIIGVLSVGAVSGFRYAMDIFSSLHASIQPLVSAIPSASSEPAPAKPLPPVTKHAAPPKPIPQPLIDLKAQQPAQAQPQQPLPQPQGTSSAPSLPPKPSSSAAPAQPAQPTYKPRPFEAEPLKKPTVPDPVITDDMDEETRAIVMKRYEEDKMTAEQKWVMMRKRRELEEQIHNEKEQRIVDDQKEEMEYEAVVRQHQEKMHNLQSHPHTELLSHQVTCA